MLNVRRRQWLLVLLSGFLFSLAYSIGLGGQLLAILTPTAMAASNQSDCTVHFHGPAFGRDAVVDTNEIECGNMTIFGGTLAINGEVKGDIVAFNSRVVIAGTVAGNISLYGGTVILQSGAHIQGDVHLYGSHWTQGPNTLIDGSVIDHTSNINWLFAANSAFRFSLWSLLLWLGFGILLTLLLPEHVMLVRTTVVSKTRRSFIIGLLSILLVPAVLVVLVALVLSIPLAIIVGLGLIAAWGLGTVAIGWLVGDYVLSRAAPQHNTRQGQIIVGLTILVLAGSLPFIGWLISIGVGLLGLGAVFLSRFGTRLYSSPKKPLTL